MVASKDDAGSRTKVAKLIKKYNLKDLGDELERMWTTDGEDHRSLRDLSHIFNKKILQAVIEESDTGTLGTDVDGIYLRLQGEKGTSADQTRVRRQLKREGVDVNMLKSDFVTYQAIRSYLKKERNAKYNPDTNPVERDRNNIQKLRNRTKQVTETKLSGLKKGNHIYLGPYDISVDINVFCEECGRQFDVTEILDQKRCDCNQ